MDEASHLAYNRATMDEDRVLTISEPCPYLPGETSTAEVFKAEGGLDRYEELIPLGWRRSGNLLYRYRCTGCSRCTPIRIPASRIQGGKRLSRLLNLNSDISLRILPSRLAMSTLGCMKNIARLGIPRRIFRARRATGT